MKKTRIRLFIEVTLVILLGYGAYVTFVAPPSDSTDDQAAKPPEQSQSPARVSGFIQDRTDWSKAGKAPKPKPTQDPATAFNAEPTSASPADSAEFVENLRELTVAVLRGQVTDSQGNLIQQPALVFSTDCRFNALVEGGVFAVEVDPGECSIQARRQEGEYILESEPVQITTVAGETTEIQLVLPDLQYGDVGIELVLHPEVAEVTAVHPGSAAADAGMAPGHFIMTLDGQAIAGMDAASIEAAMVGPVGSQLQVVVVAETEDGSIQEFPVALDRRALQ